MPKFGKASRILKPAEFQSVRRDGRSVRSGRLTVAAVPGSKRRLGVVVTRRTGNAVTRNRLKRVIREYFRNNGEAFPKGDCVVIPGTGSAKLTNDELRSNLTRALGLLAGKLETVIRGGE
jgi:ribonuclease P protein component